MARKGGKPAPKQPAQDDEESWKLPAGYEEITPSFESHDGWVQPSPGLTVAGKLLARKTMTTSNGEGAFFLMELTAPCSVFDDEEEEKEAVAGEKVAVMERQGTKLLATLAPGTPVLIKYVDKVKLANGNTWWKTKVAIDKRHKGNEVPF